MKNTIKQAALCMAVLFAALFTACEKNDKDADFGLTYIYMPQALLANLNYTVPAGVDASNFNYTITDSKVNVRLGVLRSGKSALQAYTVNIAANQDTINTLITNKVLDATTTVVMPTAMYTLPATVDVAAGQSGTQFFLALDKAMVKTYAGKKLALGVVVSGTTAYTINRAINKVVVIVDVNALKL